MSNSISIFSTLIMPATDRHYCFSCRTMVTKSERVLHMELGHDVDEHSQAYYEEKERCVEVL
jgi:hypothetical protein